MMALNTDCPMGGADGVAGNANLEAQGWTRRFLATPERAAEALELYRSMNLEVRTEKPSAADFGEGCTACAETGCQTSVMIYTRPKEPQK